MKKVSILTLSLVMLINSSVVFSAPRKRRNAGGVIPTATTTTTTLAPIILEEVETQNTVAELEASMNTQKEKKISDLLSTLNQNMQEVKNSCSGIKDDLKAIQVLAGVSTGASSLGTLTSGGALVTGIMKAKTDKELNDLSNMSSLELYEYAKNLEEEKSKLEKKSKTLGNVRTGLMAGSIATSATSTITSGVNIKKLDDLISKMKSCNNAITSLDANIKNAEAEDVDTDLTSYKNISESCKNFDTNNIKEIKGVMTASTVVGGVGTAVSTAGTITSALANSQQVRSAVGEEGAKKEKGLNLASNIMAGVSTATSGAGIVLGAVTLKKLQDNVDTAEKCEDALK